jgi:hypothetical protein
LFLQRTEIQPRNTEDIAVHILCQLRCMWKSGECLNPESREKASLDVLSAEDIRILSAVARLLEKPSGTADGEHSMSANDHVGELTEYK